MKCPKCDYLGFETGDRCKLCGYDFSLSAPAAYGPGDAFRGPEAAGAPDLFDDGPLWNPASVSPRGQTPDGWLHDIDQVVDRSPVPGSTPDIGAAPVPSPRELRRESAVESTVEVVAEPVAGSAVEPALVPGVPLPVVRAVTPAPVELSAPVLATAPPSFMDEDAPLQPPAAFRGPHGDRRGSGPDLASLPLFLANAADDTPLVTVPARPRQPLAVRRTPDTPRLRVVPHAEVAEPALDFRDQPAPAVATALPERRADGPLTELVAWRRVGAVAIDLALLLGIDAAVLYFTLRMTGLGGDEALTLPLVPFGIFLAMLKVGYFAAFTTVGGQTIGKMAVGLRVVSGDFGPVAADAALRRTLVSALDVATLGLAYLPALIGSDRRAVHDRLAGTRVVARQQA